jgi:hypothetical protein
MMTSSAPLTLSVVVVIVSDTTDSRREASHLEDCLQALRGQVDPPSMEILVPYKPPVEGIDRLKQYFPQVEFIEFDGLKSFTGQPGSREHHDELRARGLEAARGQIIALLEDHARPDAHWSTSVVKAHQNRYAAYAGVGGAIENGVEHTLNWAVYFCDFGKYENPVSDGDSLFASDANVSYKRAALESIKPVWQEVFHETAVNWALTSRGAKLALSPDAVVYQNRTGLNFHSALKERFIWGRSYAAARSRSAADSKRLLYVVLSPLLPLILLARMTTNALRKGRNVNAFFKAFPLTAILTVCWSLGELVGYLTAKANGLGVTTGRPFPNGNNPADS